MCWEDVKITLNVKICALQTSATKDSTWSYNYTYFGCKTENKKQEQKQKTSNLSTKEIHIFFFLYFIFIFIFLFFILYFSPPFVNTQKPMLEHKHTHFAKHICKQRIFLWSNPGEVPWKFASDWVRRKEFRSMRFEPCYHVQMATFCCIRQYVVWKTCSLLTSPTDGGKIAFQSAKVRKSFVLFFRQHRIADRTKAPWNVSQDES